MIILIDIGNSRITIGKAVGRRVSVSLNIHSKDRPGSIREISGILSRIFNADEVEGCALSSVVPSATSMFSKAVRNCCGISALEITNKIKTGLIFKIKTPSSLGADRIANAAAAMHIYKTDVIVADFGTATTCCLVTGKGEFKGGVIMPGPVSLLECLVSKTAQLPSVRLRPAGRILGQGTAGSMANGIMIGHAGAVIKVVGQMKAESGLNPLIVATGGLAGIMSPLVKADDINRKLTLEGLRILHEMNA